MSIEHDHIVSIAIRLAHLLISTTLDTEGSSWHAFEAIDKVFLGGRNPEDAASPINNSFQTEFLFGCQVKESGLFVTQLADGIMGMSAHPSTLPKVMYDQEKLEHNMFSICFRRELHVSKRGIVAGEKKCLLDLCHTHLVICTCVNNLCQLCFSQGCLL